MDPPFNKTQYPDGTIMSQPEWFLIGNISEKKTVVH